MFTVGVGQGRVLSPRLFIIIVCMNWMVRHSRVDDDVTVGSCRINHLLLADILVLLASSERDFPHALSGLYLSAINQEET